MQGFASGSNLEIPEPLGVIPEANLVLMGTAEGARWTSALATGPIDAALAERGWRRAGL